MTWADLNKRQQLYLQAIYEQDQENEADEKSKWARGGRPRPAVEWRWMFYGILPYAQIDSPLRARLKYGPGIDEGTGSTFEALEKRGLILVQYRGELERDAYVQVTPAGRRLVHAATGQQREKPLPTGMLREWHWKALALAWSARPAGVKADISGYYGHISWNTWLRLRDYKRQGEESPLVEEYSTGRPTSPDYWIHLTPAGEEFYQENWAHYRELYPAIAAPAPDPAGDTVKESQDVQG